MVKQSKTQVFLIFSLGAMIFGQVGVALLQGRPSSQTMAHAGGSAKAFGLVIPHEPQHHVSSKKELDHLFDNWGFNLTKAKSEGKAPRLYLAKLPKDMRHKKGESSRRSRSAFIQVVLPHVLKVNEQILADRAKLLTMLEAQKKGKHIPRMDKIWLSKLAFDYRCKSTRIESLLMHVDVVPPSLALAQGILESGWGTSHAAVQKNSTFGHMKTKTKVEKFESLLHNVVAYIQNLNRHAAYKEFRKIRASQRQANKALCGYVLATGLKSYSIRKTAYIKDLQKLINNHKLDGYDHITLEQHMRMKP
jgi:Bax protein